MSRFGQFAATSQFYLMGRKHFTKTGWEKHRKAYDQPDLLTQDINLSEGVYMITGANSGVGREVTQFLASKNAAVYMLCRSRQRAEQACAEIIESTGNSNVHVLVGDVSLEADVRRCWQEFVDHRPGSSTTPRLDALMCNAGAMESDKVLTSEGVEITFASHLLFGTYLLGSLAMPSLRETPESRLVVVSSGGMYNVPFPAWEVATATTPDPTVKFDGQLAYAYAKRGQVLLCEQWAIQNPTVKVVSCHPGWTLTPAVDLAYGDSKKYLEPMRTPWEGAEGMVWLCVAPTEKLESGAFYLDRKPQAKHVAGPFFTEGNYTKNSPESVASMMSNLDDWTNGRRPTNLAERSEALAACAQARQAPLQAMDRPIDLQRFMGRWYVVANIPTIFDRNTVNNIEEYTYDEARQGVNITFSYSNVELTKTSCMKQRAAMMNEAKTEWKLSSKVGVRGAGISVPLPIPYLVVDCAEDYSSTIIGTPDRSYVWIMTRVHQPEKEVVESLKSKAELLGYKVTDVVDVPQNWGANDLPIMSEAEEALD
jgi:dehydrogenase/reductase SDR family protein 12